MATEVELEVDGGDDDIHQVLVVGNGDSQATFLQENESELDMEVTSILAEFTSAEQAAIL
jgi:hypothetical protein